MIKAENNLQFKFSDNWQTTKCLERVVKIKWSVKEKVRCMETKEKATMEIKKEQKTFWPYISHYFSKAKRCLPHDHKINHQSHNKIIRLLWWYWEGHKKVNFLNESFCPYLLIYKGDDPILKAVKVKQNKIKNQTKLDYYIKRKQA